MLTCKLGKFTVFPLQPDKIEIKPMIQITGSDNQSGRRFIHPHKQADYCNDGPLTLSRLKDSSIMKNKLAAASKLKTNGSHMKKRSNQKTSNMVLGNFNNIFSEFPDILYRLKSTDQKGNVLWLR